MSLFDRWMSNLGVSKSSLNAPLPHPHLTSRVRRKSDHNSTSDSDSQASTPSHKSFPSVVSPVSIKAPQVQPSQESRIVRSGPQDHRRRTLVPSHRGSGDEDRNEVESRPSTFRHPFEQSRLLADKRPQPATQRVRSNGRFLQTGPLTVEQIRDLFWVEEIAPEDHYIETARSLNLFRQRKRHCDVRLLTETGRLYAHKAILVCFSQDLQNRLEASSLWKTGKISVDLSNRGFEGIAMDLVINWMYTGSIRCNIRDNRERLFTVADGLGIPRLTKVYQKLPPITPVRPVGFEPGSHVSLAASSIRARSGRSHTKAWPSFSTVMMSEEFLRWPVEKILAFLSSDSLTIETELDVYKAAVRWLNHTKPSRIGHLDSLMNCVRWIFMTPQEIVDVKHIEPLLFSQSAVSTKAAMGQWQRDLLRRGIQLPSNALPTSRCEQAKSSSSLK